MTTSDEFSGNYMESHRASAEPGEKSPGTLTHHRQLHDCLYEFSTEGGASLQIHVLEDQMIRFRYQPDGRFEAAFSYAIDPAFQPQHVVTQFTESASGITLSTPSLHIHIAREALKVRITRPDGTLLCEDASGFHWKENATHGGYHVRLEKRCFPDECFHGLGDKSRDLDLRGGQFELWGSDTYAYTRKRDPLYKNIPFYLALHRGGSYGIFFDNSFRTRFDFAKKNPHCTSFSAPGGEMNYVFFSGAQPLDVARAYARLTGVPGMPPLWALGYHQCKWSYYPEANVREIAQGFRSRRIPCDSIYLDIDYMNGYRCFTWDRERFPNPRNLLHDLEQDGFKTVVIIDPGLKIDPDYPVWKQGLENDYFCKRQEGDLYQGSVWPGPCHFPDFTHPQVREWWAGWFHELIAEHGVHGVWNDMNEPAVFDVGTFPEDVRHDYDGHPCSHRKGHNVYGMQMARATLEGLKRFNHGRRPFTLTRSAFAGTQRFAAAWTGDNVASWEHLAIANHQCQRMAISGMSFIGSDIGGFIETPTPELYLRWVQLAVFHPFFRTHSSGDHGDQEPWSFGEEVLTHVRKAIELRYRLLPVHYSAFRQYVTEGTPILRPISLSAADQPELRNHTREFLLGDHLLIAPITRPGQTSLTVHLPQGDWFQYHDDRRLSAKLNGNRITCNQNQIPAFVRAGAVLPHWPVQQHVGEIPHPEPILHVWWKSGSEQSFWYEDDGEDESWRDGNYRESRFTSEATASDWQLHRSVQGQWKPGYAKLHLTLHGIPSAWKPARLFADGIEIPFTHRSHDNLVACLPPDFNALHLENEQNG